MACQQAGASIAAVALENGVNANLVHRWIRERQSGVIWADRDGGKFVFCSDEFKRAVVAQCQEAGASMTAIAYSHGLRPALVYRWVKAMKRKQPSIPALAAPPADDWLPVWVPEEAVSQKTPPQSKTSLPAPVPEAGHIAIEFSGARIQVPVCSENILTALRVILESLR